MTSHEHRRFAPAKTTAAQSDAYRRLVREWRDEWRTEMAARHGEADGGRASRPTPGASPKRASMPPAAKPENRKPQRPEAAKFAAAIARDAFGRFYWNGKQAMQLAEAVNPKGAPKGATKGAANGATKHAGTVRRRP